MIFDLGKKFYDHVLKNYCGKLWRKKGVCMACIQAIQNLYEGIINSVRNSRGEIKHFSIGIRLHQDSALSSCLI